MDAEKYKNRYRAVIEYANGAMFNVAELDTWATLNKVPIAFQKLLSGDGLRDNHDLNRHYVSHEILSSRIASNLVPRTWTPTTQKCSSRQHTITPSRPIRSPGCVTL